ncbi:hypothetical protein BH23ACT5_BH23ACT5_06530 [soil metagenome]
MSHLEPLGPSALTIRRIRIVLEALVTAVVIVAAWAAARRFWEVEVTVWAVVVVGVVMIGGAWMWAAVDHRRWGWRLSDDLFEVQRGVIVRQTALVPRSRIQNVTTSAGPLQNRFGLVTLTVHTAGARTRNVSVEDLDVGHAEAIRRRLGLI